MRLYCIICVCANVLYELALQVLLRLLEVLFFDVCYCVSVIFIVIFVSVSVYVCVDNVYSTYYVCLCFC